MIDTAYYNSPIGWLKLSATTECITAVQFYVTEKNGIEGELAPISTGKKFPLLDECMAALDNYFEGKCFNFQLPLMQQGTVFQQNVWRALQTVPPGKTMSYLQLSRIVGDEKAIRAVGTANGKNNIAIIVPCHRIIGANGSLVGYGGDLWRKKWLLNHEAKCLNGLQTLF